MEVVLRPSFFFHLFTVNLLGLLLPLSFLLLGRLSSARYLAALPSTAPPLVYSLILYIDSPLLYILVSFVTISALLHSLTGKSALPAKLPGLVSQSRLYAAWIFLYTLQVCVGVGIEGSLSAGLNDAVTDHVEGAQWSRVMFFLGLHEAVVHWTRAVVKPVVDDTVYGEARKERWFEKAATAVCFGGLWWWRLRDEAAALVVAADFAGWWLYYVTVAIGIAKIVRSFAWFGRNYFVFKKPCKISSPTHDHEDVVIVEDKV